MDVFVFLLLLYWDGGSSRKPGLRIEVSTKFHKTIFSDGTYYYRSFSEYISVNTFYLRMPMMITMMKM